MNPLARFDRAADDAARRVIASYSTSFGMAVRLLGRRHRQHVRNIYAMVRVADEIVDGVAEAAGLDRAAQREALDRYIADTHRAMATGYSPDLVLHAFARTARASGIDESLTQPFFDAMRSDLGRPDAPADDRGRGLSPAEHASYVYGSAEVVGLMCVQVFLRARPVSTEDRERVIHGARQLGAAFQNVNFLRDLADDTDRLGRSYLSADGVLDDDARRAWLRTTRGQLAEAARTIPLLPRDARTAVRTALSLFSALTDRVARTPLEDLYRRRVRVPGAVKALLTLRAIVTTWRDRTP